MRIGVVREALVTSVIIGCNFQQPTTRSAMLKYFVRTELNISKNDHHTHIMVVFS